MRIYGDTPDEPNKIFHPVATFSITIFKADATFKPFQKTTPVNTTKPLLTKNQTPPDTTSIVVDDT